MTLREVRELADVRHRYKDIGAPLSSGSYVTAGMLVAPCSIKTLSGIVHSYNDNLITRAADVCLKERRRVVLLVRETPLHLGHLELMEQATRYGAVIVPPVPAFYHRPQSIDDIVNQTIGRTLDLFGLESGAAVQALRLTVLYEAGFVAYMNGVEVCRELRSDGRVDQVLFMSGHAEDFIVEHGVTPDAVDFIQKPFLPVVLAGRVRDVLDGSRV